MTLEQMRAGVTPGDDGTLIYPGPDGSLGIWRDGDKYAFEDGYDGGCNVVREASLMTAERKMWEIFWEGLR